MGEKIELTGVRCGPHRNGNRGRKEGASYRYRTICEHFCSATQVRATTLIILHIACALSTKVADPAYRYGYGDCPDVPRCCVFGDVGIATHEERDERASNEEQNASGRKPAGTAAITNRILRFFIS